jgi:hypothetical protein
MKFVKTYETFTTTKALYDQSYIKEEGDKVLIKAINPNNFEIFQTKQWVEINYRTLIRFLLYEYFHEYSGNNHIIKEGIRVLKEKQEENPLFKVITMIPTNYHFFKNHVAPYVPKKIPEFKNITDIEVLNNIWEHRHDIFTEENLIDTLLGMRGTWKKARQSEEWSKYFLKSYFPDWGVYTPKKNEDIRGIDLWLVKKGQKREGVQVKRIKKPASMFIKKPDFQSQDYRKREYTIFLNQTSLDISSFNKFEDRPLPYKYLVIWDENKKEVYLVETSVILRIVKLRDTVIINLDSELIKSPADYQRYVKGKKFKAK